MKKTVIIGIFITIYLLGSVFAAGPILLSNVRELHFRAGELTAARRAPPINQMTCIGGTAQRESHRITYAKCTNLHWGTDNQEPVWRCELGSWDNVKLGKAWVNCEGYKSSDDPYVLDGSCALEYTLDYNYPKPVMQSNQKPKPVINNPTNEDSSNAIISFFQLLLCGIIVLGVFKIIFAVQEKVQHRTNQKPLPRTPKTKQHVPNTPAAPTPPMAPRPPIPNIYTRNYYRENPQVHTTLHVTDDGVSPVTTVTTDVAPGLSVCSHYGTHKRQTNSQSTPRVQPTGNKENSSADSTDSTSKESDTWSVKTTLAETKRR
jgi:hypothetical protein